MLHVTLLSCYIMIAAAYHVVDVAIKRAGDEADAVVIGTRRAVWFVLTAIWSMQNIILSSSVCEHFENLKTHTRLYD